MRHAFLAMAASTFLAVLVGCACPNGNCNNQGGSGGDGSGPGGACRNGPCLGGAGLHGPGQQDPGPGGMVSYPYYTTRGPRDFLETHPQSIGP
jgi:hypothetical protein